VSLKRLDVNAKIWVDRIPAVLLASPDQLLDDFDSTEAGEHTVKVCRQIFGHVTPSEGL
jgi:hypothetical protein